MRWGCDLLIWGQKVKGRGHNAWIIENGNLCKIAFSLHISSWNFTHRLLLCRGCGLLICRSKGQRSRSQCIDNLLSLYTFHHETSHKNPCWVEMCSIDFEVKMSEVRVTMHWLLKMVYVAWLLSLYAFHHETSHTLVLSWGCALWFWG